MYYFMSRIVKWSEIRGVVFEIFGAVAAARGQ